jgi:hypothetical protein
MLERKRDDIVPSAVLQMHTAIEDLLNSMIICRILKAKPGDRQRKQRSHSARALRKMLFGGGSIGFDMKLNFAVALGLLTERTKENLTFLNTLRNKSGHNWSLKAPVRRGTRPKQKKPLAPCLQRARPAQCRRLRRIDRRIRPDLLSAVSKISRVISPERVRWQRSSSAECRRT